MGVAISEQAAAAADAINARLMPAREKFDERVRQGRRAAVRGQHLAEDALDAGALLIRRRPWKALLIAGGVGTLAGLAFGLVCGRLARCSDRAASGT